MQEQVIQIPKSKYLELCDAQQKLQLLEYAGVDNWTYYDDALKDFVSEADKELEM